MEAATSRTHVPIRTARSAARESAIAAQATYWLVAASLYVLQGALWYYSFKEKLFDDNGTAPLPIRKEFAGTIVDNTIGTNVAWVVLGVMEGLVFAAIVVSLVRGEFLPTRRKPWMLAALSGGMLTFAVLLFGQSLTSQFDSVAQLFAYFAGSAVLIGLVSVMPPYRKLDWLSSEEH
jgi:hypothetical protein